MILCGPGKALSPFSKVRSTGVPKALLPIANKPMIEYVLDWCEKAFFPRVTVVCDEGSGDVLENAIKEYKARKNSGSKGSTELEDDSILQFTNSIEVTQVNTSNSGEVLQYLHKKNTLSAFEHFVLLPCDFITNLPPQVLIEAYRSRPDSDMGILVYYKNQLDIEDKKNKIFPKNYTIYAELPSGQAQFLDYYSTDDVEFHKALKVRTQMVWNYPNSSVSTRLLNSSIFFGCTEQVFGAFEENKLKFSDAYFASRPVIKVVRDLARKTWQSPSPARTIGFLLMPHQAQFFRSNNLPVLLEANRHYLKLQAQNNAGRQTPKEKTSANVGADAIVGENTQLGEKTTVKRTVVGANCTIGKRVKLTGSIILDNVTIDDDVQLENCIIGHNVTIRSKSKLVSCYVESTHEVAKATQSKGDTLLCFTLEGLVEEDPESSEESSLESYTESEEDEVEYGDNSDGLFAY